MNKYYVLTKDDSGDGNVSMRISAHKVKINHEGILIFCDYRDEVIAGFAKDKWEFFRELDQ